MTAPTIDQIASLAVEVMLQTGQHSGMLFLYQEKLPTIINLAGLPGEARFAFMTALGSTLSEKLRAYGLLTDLFFVNEAWLTETTRERWQNEPPPSEHPDRIEVLMVAHYQMTARKIDVRMFNMLRNDNTLELQMRSDEGIFSSDLISAFVQGWQS
jgi:hypothetical protein